VVTPPTGRPRGRPPKNIISAPRIRKKKPEERTKYFFNDPDRFALALFGSLLIRGREPWQASLIVAYGKTPRIWCLTDAEREGVNRERRRQGKKHMLSSGGAILSPLPHTTPEGRASTIRKKFQRCQRDPVAAHWLKLMAESFAMASVRREQGLFAHVINVLGPQLEIYVQSNNQRET
jgi:hypothetical protein